MGLMEENSKIRVAVLESVNGLSDQLLNQHLDQNKWTIAQVLVHLFLLEKGVSKLISTALKDEEKEPVDQKPIHLVLDRSKKFKAPTHLVPRDEFTTMVEIQEKLRQSRDGLNKVLSGVSDDQLEKRSLPHPVLGELTLKQWVELVGLHEKRHLAQIEEIKQELVAE